MDILVIDRDSLACQLISSRLGALGHTVTVEPNKTAALEQVAAMTAAGRLDCILIDPAPMADARPVMIGLWKNIKSAVKPYIFLLGKTAGANDAVLAGANDMLTKPIDTRDIETKAANAERLITLSRWLATDDNAHSGGGMIGKAAFYQLFLSAIDRSFRYAEKSLIVFISLANEDEIVEKLGRAGYDAMVDKLTAQMTYMRRQSDVIARLGTHDFAILLQRPQYESEPVDALNRFSETLTRFRLTEIAADTPSPRLTLKLIGIPQGALVAERAVS